VTPDIATIVQEVVNRELWAAGNALTVLLGHVSGASDCTSLV
jgi:hypothetical protein